MFKARLFHEVNVKTVREVGGMIASGVNGTARKVEMTRASDALIP